MKGYLVLDIEIYDFEMFQNYAQQVKHMVDDSSGRYIVRGGNVEVIDGNWEPQRIVIVEFPSVAEAKKIFNGKKYAPLRAMADACSKVNAIVVEGMF